MLEFTGPIAVPSYGTLTPDNFVHKMVGNYNAYPDTDARKELNRALAPGLRRRAARPAATSSTKMMAVHELAQGRHFALYLRDPDVAGCLRRHRPRRSTCPTPSTTTSPSSTRTPTSASPTSGSDGPSPATSQLRAGRHGRGRADDHRSTTTPRPTATSDFGDNQRRQLLHFRWNGMTARRLPARRAPRSRSAAASTARSLRHRHVRLLRPPLQVSAHDPFPPQATKTCDAAVRRPCRRDGRDDGDLTYRLDLTPAGHGHPAGAVGRRVQWPKGYDVDAPARGLGARRPRRGRRTTTRVWSRSRASASPAPPPADAAP